MLDLFFGCVLVAFGPATVFLLQVVVPHSHLAVLTIVSAFFQLVALLFTSLIHLIPGGGDSSYYLTLCLGAVFQHLARLVLVGLNSRVERALLNKSGMQALPWTQLASAVGCGFGFGLMNALVLFGGVLGKSAATRGDAYACGDSPPRLSVFVVEAVVALGMQVGQVAWMVVVFLMHDGKRGARYYASSALVFALHLLAALSTALNSQVGCNVGVSVQWTVVLVSVALAGVVVANKTSSSSTV